MGRVFDDLSRQVIAAAIAVHKQLGPGFLEGVYEQALRLELGNRKIPFETQKEILVRYDGKVVGRHVLDLLIAGEIVVELQAVAAFEQVHFAQVKSYLRATGISVGLLMNFAGTTLDVKRVVLNYEQPQTDG